MFCYLFITGSALIPFATKAPSTQKDKTRCLVVLCALCAFVAKHSRNEEHDHTKLKTRLTVP
jgi:hypothetical protein